MLLAGLLVRGGDRPARGSPVANPDTAQQAGPVPTGLRAAGNRLLNGAGQEVQLRGVNYSGTEYACIQGWGIFDGPSDVASVQVMASWGINAVRLPLNEDCWLGINGVRADYGGAAYQSAIGSYVSLLLQHGIVPVLDLHWSAPGNQRATRLLPMPDREHAPEFWRQVATRFKSQPDVVFDLFNEPSPDSNRDSPAAWVCWRDGGTCPGVPYETAGMQELVTAVRETGATNLILLSGVQHANALSGWLTHRPLDPADNLAVAIHVYPQGNRCGSVECYEAQYAPVAQQVPLIAAEFGESTDGSVCSTTRSNALLDWLDQRNASYLAWVWNTWGTSCGDLSLILDFAGTPHAPNGTSFRSRLTRASGQPGALTSAPVARPARSGE